MNRTVIKLDLDTGDFVSSAGRAQRSIAGLTDEMKKAQEEGRFEDSKLIEIERDRLKGRTSGFEKDVRTAANDPRFQTMLPNGTMGLKIDAEYANAIKSYNESIEELTDELHDIIHIGDVGGIRKLVPLIEKEQAGLQKTIKDIINTNGELPQKPPLDNDTPDGREKPHAPSLPPNDDWRELKGLSGAITQEHQARNWEQVAKLGTAKDTLRGIMGEYDRDGKMEAKLKAEPELASQLKEIRDALKGTIAAINEAADNREYEKVDQLTGQAKQLQGISHKTVQEAAAPPDSKKARDAALASFLNVQTTQQMIGAVTSGINTYVAHLDRSGIVNAMGSGDVMGAQIEELHRSAAEQSSLWGSIGRIGGGILGGIVGTFIGGPGLGTAGGAAIGSTLLGAGGDLVGTLGDEKKANEMATSEAYSKLWEQQAPDAMELTGLLGKYVGTEVGPGEVRLGKLIAEVNTRTMRHTWENAANTATEYGFSPEEGVEQVKQAAQQGLDERQALDAARDVFAFERGTGADRGVLAEFRNRTERFGIADGLNTAWQGNQASGMAPGQFNEFLRSMQKTFEDGISKGFVRGADEIAGNLSFLSGLNGDSELWKGELGANRLATMNSGLEATTALSSASDILSFRGAQNLLKQWDNAGMTLDSEGRTVSVADEKWRAIGDLDPTKKADGSNPLELRRGYDYIDAMAILERGLTPELFHTQMQMIEGVEGKGNRTGAVEQMKNIYGLNYTGAAALYQSYQDKLKTFNGDSAAADKYFSGDEWAKKLKEFKDNPNNNDSTELNMFQNVADIKKYTYEIGQWHLDKKNPAMEEALNTAWAEASGKGGTTDTGAGEHSDPFPEEQPADPYPEETPAPTPVQQTLAELAVAATAPSGPGYNDNLKQAQTAAIEAQVDEGRRMAQINRRTKDATKYLFSEGAFNLGKEAPQMNAINETVSSAITSGNFVQFNAAQEFSEIIGRFGSENGFRDAKKYDENNTFNSLAEFNGDMLGMLNALRSLIERIDGVQVEVSPED